VDSDNQPVNQAARLGATGFVLVVPSWGHTETENFVIVAQTKTKKLRCICDP
jgi:hypothetical protein